MEKGQNKATFRMSYRLLLYLAMAFDIYCCFRHLFMAYQIPERGSIRFKDSFTGFLIATILINLYPLVTGLMLKNNREIVDGNEADYEYDTSTRSFGEGLIAFSLVIYFLLFASYIIRMFEN